MAVLLIVLASVILLVLLATPLWWASLIGIACIGMALALKESKEKRAFYTAARLKGLNRHQATKWLEYNDKKMPGTAIEWKKKAEFINSQDDNYVFNYHSIKPGSYATKKWTPFFIGLVIFLMLVVAGASLSNSNTNKQANVTVPSQPAPATTGTAQPTNTQSQSFTSCNPDGSVGQNCTSTSASGVNSTHCNSNQMGGYNCY